MAAIWKHLSSDLDQVRPLLLVLFNIVLEILAREIKNQEKKGVRIEKEMEIFLYANDIVLYMEKTEHGRKAVTADKPVR